MPSTLPHLTDEKIDIKKEFATKCRPDCTPPSCLHSLPPCLFMMQVSQGKAQVNYHCNGHLLLKAFPQPLTNGKGGGWVKRG